ncbi:MAG: anti-sigma factor [Bryobacteraceae bacterium]
MTPQELRDQCQLYALGVLDGEELAEMERLLTDGNEDVKEALHEAILANATIASLVPQMEPSKRLRKKLLAAVGQESSERGWNWMWPAVAAMLVIGMVWLGIDNRGKSAEIADLAKAADDTRVVLAQVRADYARVNAAVRFLDEPETRLVGFGKGEPAPPRGNVFVNPKSGVLLVASNMPKLDAGKTYQMWVIPKGGKPVPAGLFGADSGGTAVHLLAGAFDLQGTGAVAVTVEPGGGSSQPTSTPIIVAPLAGL